MSMKASKPMIGLFIVGSVVLAVATLAILGSGLLFTKRLPVIMYFEGSVSGLEVGAPVLFRGVTLGSVKEIHLVADPKRLKFSIPVRAEFIGGRVELPEDENWQEGETLLSASGLTPEQLIKALVEKGLRAQLVTQSLLTGQLAVSLDMLPDTPILWRGNGRVIEIPTIPSEFTELTKSLKALPLEELAAHLLSAVKGVERLVNSPETPGIPGKVDTALTSGTQLFDDLRTQVGSLTRNLDQAVHSYKDLAGNLDQRSDKLTISARKSLEALDGVLADGKSALSKFQKVVNPESPSVVELNKTLVALANAAKAIRNFSEYLERHPEALIQGKGNR